MRPTRTRAIVAIGAALGSAPLALGCSRTGERPNDEAPPDAAADPVTSAPAVDAGAVDAQGSKEGSNEPPACGHENEPDCPLQAWMKATANDAVRSNDPDELAAAFDTMVRFAPPDRYPNWISIAQDGARVARQGDPEAARAACRSCHVQYEGPYRAELRARPL